MRLPRFFVNVTIFQTDHKWTLRTGEHRGVHSISQRHGWSLHQFHFRIVSDQFVYSFDLFRVDHAVQNRGVLLNVRGRRNAPVVGGPDKIAVTNRAIGNRPCICANQICRVHIDDRIVFGFRLDDVAFVFLLKKDSFGSNRSDQPVNSQAFQLVPWNRYHFRFDDDRTETELAQPIDRRGQFPMPGNGSVGVQDSVSNLHRRTIVTEFDTAGWSDNFVLEIFRQWITATGTRYVASQEHFQSGSVEPF